MSLTKATSADTAPTAQATFAGGPAPTAQATFAGGQSLARATFAGGCFWCIESAFTTFKGVVRTTSGLTGGSSVNPSYEDVHKNPAGHREAVLIEFDPSIVTYSELLDQFWRQIDPTDPDGQFADRGELYTTAIYYHDQDQQKLAEESKQSLINSGKFNGPIATTILPASDFYPAEEYQQGYASKHPLRYQLYKKGSGRADYIHQTWSK